MNKIIQKILIILIIFIMVFEFSFSNTVSAADNVSVKTINGITNLGGGIVSILIWKDRFIATLATFGINKAMKALAKIEGSSTTDTSIFLTPYSIFFNDYKILGINFFNVNEVQNKDSFVHKFRVSVANWFYVIRTISVIMLLVILIYVGIRMGISTVAEEKARYKKMLVDWVCSLILVFLLQYIAISVIYVNDILVEALKKVVTDSGNLDEIIIKILEDSLSGITVTSIASTIVFCALTAQSILFFLAYFKRVIKIGFLIIISPLISITYSIDKMGDGKAQALNNWFKEFLYTVLIQPFHCIIYIGLIKVSFDLITNNAVNIAPSSWPNILQVFSNSGLTSAILAALSLKFVNDAEKVVRSIFGIKEDESTATSLAAGALIATAAMKNASKYGGMLRKGTNALGNSAKRATEALGNDTSRISEKLPMAKKIMDVGKGAKDNLQKVGQKQGGIFDKLGKGINGAKTLAGKYKGSKFRRGLRASTPRALRLMGFAMAYATGDTGLLAANAYGTSIEKASAEYFNTSTETLALNEAKNNQILDDAEYDELNENLAEKEEEMKNLAESMGVSEEITAEEAKELRESVGGQEARENAKKAAEEVNRAKKMYEEQAKKASEIEARIKEAEAAKKMAKTKRKRNEIQRKIDEEKANYKNRSEARDNLLKHLKKKNEALEIAKEEADKYEKLVNTAIARENLKNSIDNFYTEGAKEARIRSRLLGTAQKSDLTKKKNEILKLIMKLERLRNEVGVEDSTQTNLMTLDEEENAQQTLERIVGAVDLSILKGGASIKGSDYLKDRTGLNSRSSLTLDSIDKTTKDIDRATKEYEMLSRSLSMSKTNETNSSYNGNTDRLVEELKKLTADSRNETSRLI